MRYHNGKIYASIIIDLRQVFDNLSISEQKKFITNNISLISDDDLLNEINARGILKGGKK